MVSMYRVGGEVRDKILYNIRGGTPLKSKDRDYAVEAHSYEEMLLYIRDTLGYKIFLETPEYFTIRALDHEGVGSDFVLCRQEGPYSDGRHPDWVKPGTIYDDLARRDATCNAIAINVDTGEMLDPHGGVKHMEQGVIYPVGSVLDRCREDGLRLIRYLRFSITKGLELGWDISWLLRDDSSVDMLSGVSSERIRDELTKMFSYSSVISMRALTTELNSSLLEHILDKSGIWLMPTSKERRPT